MKATSTEMYSGIQEKSFEPQLKMLRIVGISFREKDTIIYNIYSIMVLTGIILLPVLTTHATLMNLNNIHNLVQDLVFDATFAITVLKVITMLWLRKNIMSTFNKLQSDVFVPNIEREGKKEYELITECMFYSNLETMILYAMAAVYSFSASIEIINCKLTHVSSDYCKLPFGDFSLFNVTYNPNFNIIWAYQTIYVFFGTLAYCGIDIFIITVMAYISYQCKILQNLIKMSVFRTYKKMIQDIRQNDGDAVILSIETSKIKWKYFQQILKEIVEYHTSLIEITSEFENLFCYQVLINMVGFSVIICLALFYSTYMGAFNFRSLQQITLACGAAVLQLTSAYWGNEVIVQYLAIAEACSEVNFIGTDVRFQKGLCLMIQRAQIPVKFTVGKFSPLTLRTFLAVIKAAYSYYMFLQNYN